MITTANLVDFCLKISVMFSLMLIMLSANKRGVLTFLTKPLDYTTDKKKIYSFWFLFTFLLTGFVPDTIACTIALPMALLYSEEVGLSKSKMMINIAIACSAGNDLSYFGGGDNLISWTLLEKHLGHNLDMIIWSKLFLAPTLIAGVATIAIMWFTTFEKGKIKLYKRNLAHYDWQFFVSFLALAGGIYTAIIKHGEYYTMAIAVLVTLITRLPLSELKRLPLRAIYIWGGAFFIGILLDSYLKSHFVLTLPTNNTILLILLVLVVLGSITNIMTNTALSTVALPLIFALQFPDKIWLYVLAVKAIGLAYLTVFADGCYAVGAGYGMSQKELFRKGLPIILVHSIIFLIFFSLTRGHINL